MSTTCRYLTTDGKCVNIKSGVLECVLLKPNLKPGVFTVCKLEHGISAEPSFSLGPAKKK